MRSGPAGLDRPTAARYASRSVRRSLLLAGLLLAGCFPERPPVSVFVELCDNGADDDADELVDCDDPDCGPACGGEAEPRETACDDGLDDDGDGLVDCLDDDCVADCDDRERDCSDGDDDDGDGEIDCADDDCFGVDDC